MKRFLGFCLLTLWSSIIFSQRISYLEYFIDSDPGLGMATSIPISQTDTMLNLDFFVPLDTLSTGFHQLYVRALSNDSLRWSMTVKRSFYMTRLPAKPDIVYAEYFIDNDPGYGNANEIPFDSLERDGQQQLTIDISGLDPGYHTLYARILNQEGSWSIVQRRYFCVAGEGALAKIIQLEYRYEGPDGQIGSFTYVLDTSSTSIDLTFNANAQDLVDGSTYTICVIAIADNGSSSQERCEEFTFNGTTSRREGFWEKRVSIYPNPANQSIFVSVNDPKILPVSFSIIDVSGRLIKRNRIVKAPQANQVSLEGFSSGLYHLILQKKNHIYIEMIQVK